ncbi:MAG: hypothetical protein M3209_06300 [Acidobacteriota bacterium]|nr:hypothetical protein [Acidobacteriota bacterium]
MCRKFIEVLALLLVSIFFFAQNSDARKLFSGGKPKEVIIAGFDVAFCVNLSQKFRVCKTRIYDPDEVSFLIQKNKKTIGTIDATFSAFSEMDYFWAYRGDLDNDGSSEIVIASLELISNGMGISTYDVHIFRDPTRFGFQKPLTFPIQDFGEKGNLVFNAGKNETQILVTYWKYRDDIDRKRGNGMYLHGTWFRYKNGLLEPVFEKPTLARRLLYSFINEMYESQNISYAPYSWLKSKNTHRLKENGKINDKLIAVVSGTIENYQETVSQYRYPDKRTFTLRTDSGDTIDCLFWSPDIDYEEDSENKYKDKLIVSNYGFSRRKFLVPFNFSLFTLFPEINGKRVRLETRLDEYDDKYTQLWFLDK